MQYTVYAPSSPMADSLRQIEECLGSSDFDQEEVKGIILQELDDVLQRKYLVHEDIDRLAVFLETHNLNATLLSWPDERERVQHFLTAVGQARNAIRKKKSSEREIKSRWPAAVFDHYSWHDLGENALQQLQAIAELCPQWDQDAVRLLNWAMLHRDSKYRTDWARFRNTAVLIGQHSNRSGVQLTCSPLEPQDIRMALSWIKNSPHSLTQSPNVWEWERESARQYLQRYNLGFDCYGSIVNQEGKLDEGLLARFLFGRPLSNAAEKTADNLRTPASSTCQASDSESGDVDMLGVGDHKAETPHESVDLKGSNMRDIHNHCLRHVASPPSPDVCDKQSSSPSCQSSPGALSMSLSEKMGGDRGSRESSAQSEEQPSQPSTPSSSPGFNDACKVTDMAEIGGMIDDVIYRVSKAGVLKQDEYNTRKIIMHLQQARMACVSHG
jgi:hypothetical protein